MCSHSNLQIPMLQVLAGDACERPAQIRTCVLVFSLFFPTAVLSATPPSWAVEHVTRPAKPTPACWPVDSVRQWWSSLACDTYDSCIVCFLLCPMYGRQKILPKLNTECTRLDRSITESHALFMYWRVFAGNALSPLQPPGWCMCIVADRTAVYRYLTLSVSRCCTRCVMLLTFCA